MVLFLDTENTTKNKGHPFTPSNKCCVVSIASDDESPIVLKVEYDDEPYGDSLNTLKRFIELSDLLVGFNLKYDIHWLRRYNIDISKLRVWDCQVAQFIIEHQLARYPSLNGAAKYWDLGTKEDAVAKYWDAGIDTPDIPWEILSSYAAQDIRLTRDVFNAQQAYLADKPKLKKLVQLDCLDLLVLEEMEWNGMVYDVDASLKKADEHKARIKVLVNELNNIVGCDFINWNSGQQISAILYGGTIKYTVKEIVPFTYKDGRVKEKLKNVEYERKFPQLVVPIENSKLKKDGLFQTGTPILNQLKAKGTARLIIQRLMELSDLEKEVSTYLEGLPDLIKEMEWENNTIHGNLNQCVAVTGRLSSSKPNMQNNPASVDLFFKSRFD